jgi:hypothetical protein
MQDAFAEAIDRHSAGVMVIAQANPGWDLTDGTPAPLRNPRTLFQTDGQPDGFEEFLSALRAQVIAFRRPVAYVHGDSHYFRIDKPFLDDQGRRLENFTRIETFGDNQANGNNHVHWLKVLVSPRTREVFAYQPRIVTANRPVVPAPRSTSGRTLRTGGHERESVSFKSASVHSTSKSVSGRSMACSPAGGAGRAAGVLDAEVLFGAGVALVFLALDATLERDLRSALWAFFGVAASLPLRASTFFGAFLPFTWVLAARAAALADARRVSFAAARATRAAFAACLDSFLACLSFNFAKRDSFFAPLTFCAASLDVRSAACANSSAF